MFTLPTANAAESIGATTLPTSLEVLVRSNPPRQKRLHLAPRAGLPRPACLIAVKGDPEPSVSYFTHALTSIGATYEDRYGGQSP
jgi:hypothetical protein